MSGSNDKRARGRPKGTPNTATIVRKIASERMTVKTPGGSKTMTILEAVITRLQHHRMKGNLKADKAADRLSERLAPAAKEAPGVLLVPEPMSQDEWIRRAQAENQFKQQPEMPGGELPAPPPGGTAPPPAGPRRPFQPGEIKPKRLIR